MGELIALAVLLLLATWAAVAQWRHWERHPEWWDGEDENLW